MWGHPSQPNEGPKHGDVSDRRLISWMTILSVQHFGSELIWATDSHFAMTYDLDIIEDDSLNPAPRLGQHQNPLSKRLLTICSGVPGTAQGLMLNASSMYDIYSGYWYCSWYSHAQQVLWHHSNVDYNRHNYINSNFTTASTSIRTTTLKGLHTHSPHTALDLLWGDRHWVVD